MEKLFFRNVQRVRHLLTQITTTNTKDKEILEENNKILMWALSYILKVRKFLGKFHIRNHLEKPKILMYYSILQFFEKFLRKY